MEKIVLLGSLSLLFGACSAEENADKDVENGIEVITNETQEDSIVFPEITTVFEPKNTKLRELTEEDYEIYEVIMTQLNEKGHEQLDRDIVYDLATEYGEDQEKFYENWIKIVNSVFHGSADEKNIVILPEDSSQLASDVIEKNINGHAVRMISGEFKQEEIDNIGLFNYNVEIDKKEYNISFELEFSEDYSELIELYIDGEEIDLN